jgi:hypothetical protein
MAYNPLSEAEKTFILHGVQVFIQIGPLFHVNSNEIVLG